MVITAWNPPAAISAARRSAACGVKVWYRFPALDVTQPDKNLEYRWAIEGRWKLLVPDPANVPDARTELYDLEVDPHETDDLAEADPNRVLHLRALIDKWWAMR